MNGPASPLDTVLIHGTVGDPVSAYAKASTRMDKALFVVAKVAIVGLAITLSTTWIIPFVAVTFGVVTSAPPATSDPPFNSTTPLLTL